MQGSTGMLSISSLICLSLNWALLPDTSTFPGTVDGLVVITVVWGLGAIQIPTHQESQKKKGGRKNQREEGAGPRVIAHGLGTQTQPNDRPAGLSFNHKGKLPSNAGWAWLYPKIRDLEAHLRKLALGRQQQDLTPYPGCLVNTLCLAYTPLGSWRSSGVSAATMGR